RNVTTDFAAPELDIPTFRRTRVAAAPPAAGAPPVGGPGNLVFQEAGTSLSSAVVTGSFAVVTSALDYWDQISRTGVTADAYLTVPVGARTLDFGPHQIRDLSFYANPDGVNSILQWTDVPTTDAPIAADT